MAKSGTAGGVNKNMTDRQMSESVRRRTAELS